VTKLLTTDCADFTDDQSDLLYPCYPRIRVKILRVQKSVLTRRMIGARATTTAPYYERLISERSTFKVGSSKFVPSGFR